MDTPVSDEVLVSQLKGLTHPRTRGGAVGTLLLLAPRAAPEQFPLFAPHIGQLTTLLAEGSGPDAPEDPSVQVWQGRARIARPVPAPRGRARIVRVPCARAARPVAAPRRACMRNRAPQHLHSPDLPARLSRSAAQQPQASPTANHAAPQHVLAARAPPTPRRPSPLLRAPAVTQANAAALLAAVASMSDELHAAVDAAAVRPLGEGNSAAARSPRHRSGRAPSGPSANLRGITPQAARRQPSRAFALLR